MIPVEHIHPMIVHFPIVFVLVLAVFDLVAVARGSTVSGRTVAGNISTGLAVLAAGFAILAFLFGGMALDHAEDGGFHSDIAEIHESLGEYVMICLSVWAGSRFVLWWRNIRVAGAAALVFPLVAFAAAALVVVTAYYGGQLVFGLGVNVAHAAAGG
jgi:uncharacterized membrane protein